MESLLNIPQLIGYIAFFFGIVAFLSKDDKKLKILLAIQSYTLSLHFFLLGASGGMIAAFINATRNLVTLKSRMKILAPYFIAFYIIFGAFKYTNIIDLLPIVGSTIATYAFFYLEKIPMRLCLLVTTSLWLVHNGLVGSIGPFLMEIIILIANGKTVMSMIKERNKGMT